MKWGWVWMSVGETGPPLPRRFLLHDLRKPGGLGNVALLGSPPSCPWRRPWDSFEAPSWERAGCPPPHSGLHGCGAVTQGLALAQSGRGGGLAGKARVAPLARLWVGPATQPISGPAGAASRPQQGADRWWAEARGPDVHLREPWGLAPSFGEGLKEVRGSCLGCAQ